MNVSSPQHRAHRRVLTVSLAMVALLAPAALASTAQESVAS